jgi:hypothetical protein
MAETLPAAASSIWTCDACVPVRRGPIAAPVGPLRIEGTVRIQPVTARAIFGKRAAVAEAELCGRSLGDAGEQTPNAIPLCGEVSRCAAGPTGGQHTLRPRGINRQRGELSYTRPAM